MEAGESPLKENVPPDEIINLSTDVPLVPVVNTIPLKS